MDSVAGKIAIVTGGGSGIGYEFVKLIQSEGCNVMIGDLQLTPEAKKLLDNASETGKVVFKQTDVTKWNQLSELFTFTEKEFGAPDIVCPAAGIFEPAWSHFWNDTEEQGYKTIQVNVEHPTKITRLAIRSFVQNKKRGVIAHLSSIAGQTSRLPVPIYCATKAYLNHFIRAFASLEEKEGIRVIGVAPGMVRTPLWFEQNKDKLKSVGKDDLWIEPSEIAEILYDVCTSASHHGGTIVEASGMRRTRLVEVFNDAGPPGIGSSTGANMELENDIYTLLNKEKAKL